MIKCPHCKKEFEIPTSIIHKIVDIIHYDSKNLFQKRIISSQMRYQVLKDQKWKCNNCGEMLKYNKNSKWDGEISHIDHIHPYADRDSYKGNINERENLQALCERCNLKKQRCKS